MTAGLHPARPGVYFVPPQPDDALRAVRLDVAGFAGVAPRGPTDVPVLVTSWSEYQVTFGGFERAPGCPERLLPYAVGAFFAQGGARAYVLRLSAGPGFAGPTATRATARFALAGQPECELTAANEGTWGTALRLHLEFEVAATFRTSATGGTRIVLPAGASPADFSLVRLRRSDLPGSGVLRVLRRLSDPRLHDGFADLDLALDDSAPPEAALDVDVVTGTLVVLDGSDSLQRSERIRNLGLVRGHARFVPRVLAAESVLCGAAGDWSDVQVTPALTPVRVVTVHDGLDRNHGIDASSLFDPGPADADLLDEWDAHRGVDAMGRVPDLGLLAVPDLTWRAEPADAAPAPPPLRRPPSPCDGCAPVGVEVDTAVVRPVPLGLDASSADDLDEIVARQVRLVEVAELRRRFVALLDVPRGLPVHDVTAWRAHFDSSYAAAYHPWLGVTPGGTPAGVTVSVPPSAFAAGIVAARELAHGVAWGPANEIARLAVVSRDTITDSVHDQLHLLGVNVFRAERDGFRLTAARTLSRDPDYRQLSVRRLMTQLTETLTQQCQWLVFEPNTDDLRRRLTRSVTQLLRQLHRAGALAGRTEEESFFVRCDDSTTDPRSQALGRLVAEIGVAPAAPLEYLLVQISADVDAALTVAERRG